MLNFDFYFVFRDENGVGIEGASIDVSWNNSSSKKRKTILSTKDGDYYRLLLQGTYHMAVSVNGITQGFSIVIKDDHVLVFDMVVTNTSINLRSSQHVAFVINHPLQAPSAMTNKTTDSGDITLFVLLACISLILVSLFAFAIIFYRKWKVRRENHPSSSDIHSQFVDL